MCVRFGGMRSRCARESSKESSERIILFCFSSFICILVRSQDAKITEQSFESSLVLLQAWGLEILVLFMDEPVEQVIQG